MAPDAPSVGRQVGGSMGVWEREFRGRAPNDRDWGHKTVG